MFGHLSFVGEGEIVALVGCLRSSVRIRHQGEQVKADYTVCFLPDGIAQCL